MRKKIAIIGTRGIPNRYGGFEQFAENLSVQLAKKSFDVTVYNPDYHLYDKLYFRGVRIRKKKLNEKLWGAAANILYDYACMKDAINTGNHIIIACGYGSMLAALQIKRPENVKLIINMDGMEWQRRKWHSLVKIILYAAEKQAVKKADILVTDHKEIHSYYKVKYGIDNPCIPYGASIPKHFNESCLKRFGLEAGKYFLMISRPISENNLPVILQGFVDSGVNEDFIIVTNMNDRYAKKLAKQYDNTKIRFFSNIFDAETLSSLRFYSKGYFHGHSVGGTNPSLLEAMAAQCFIVAHHNVFNKTILGDNAIYFKTKQDVKDIFCKFDSLIKRKTLFAKNNLSVILS
ncbi:MAG TPA: DUF1972 domain-containing protein, partial [Bacteroidales bacterium]|nr:DUF1972 domain-containing protein [Bacteroidales bacterium]